MYNHALKKYTENYFGVALLCYSQFRCIQIVRNHYNKNQCHYVASQLVHCCQTMF